MNSPTIDYSITVYRCIDVKLNNNVGDILDNLGFIFTTFCVNYALEFSEKNSEIENEKTYGTMFKINVPKYCHFHHRFCMESPEFYISEIIFNYHHKLLIQDIQSYKNKNGIECQLYICDLI